MSVKATKSCVENLIAKGINASNIVVLTPTVVLDTVHLQIPRIDCACQADVLSSYSENWFESLLECIDVAEAELDAILTESKDDNSLFEQIDCLVQAIDFIHYDRPQCPILRLQAFLQAKGSGLDVLENNPIMFTALKQKLYKEIQCLFPRYSPLLHYVSINNFRWKVVWLWEFLVNTPIDENTYEWLQILINV